MQPQVIGLVAAGVNSASVWVDGEGAGPTPHILELPSPAAKTDDVFIRIIPICEVYGPHTGDEVQHLAGVHVCDGPQQADNAVRAAVERAVAVDNDCSLSGNGLAKRRQQSVQLIQAARLPVHAEAEELELAWPE